MNRGETPAAQLTPRNQVLQDRVQCGTENPRLLHFTWPLEVGAGLLDAIFFDYIFLKKKTHT